MRKWIAVLNITLAHGEAGIQIVRPDLSATLKNHKVFTKVSKLPDVSGPGIVLQDTQGFGLEDRRFKAVLLGKVTQEMPYQQQGVIPALSERGQVHADHVQPIKEIFPKFSLAGHFLEVPVGCANQAGIHLDGLRASQTLNGLGFEKTKQFDLCGCIDFSDFIEEKSSANGTLEAANPPFGRSCKRTLFMPEQFALKEGRGECGRNEPKRTVPGIGRCSDEWPGQPIPYPCRFHRSLEP